MDILYVLKDDGKGNNPLRYSLRSIAKYGKNVGKVYLVGFIPDWVSDEIVCLPYEQPFKKYKDKHKNIAASIKYAIDHSDIGENFLYSSDDHFYCKETDFDSYPYYCKDYTKRYYRYYLPDVVESGWKSPEYARQLILTRTILEENHLPYYGFTIHRNMHINKTAFYECWPIIENCFSTSYGVEPLAYVLNYMYSKGMFEYEVVKDVKYEATPHSLVPIGSECFSTADFERGSELDMMVKSLYPNMCKYER